MAAVASWCLHNKARVSDCHHGRVPYGGMLHEFFMIYVLYSFLFLALKTFLYYLRRFIL
jgi:hypothetical protein